MAYATIPREKLKLVERIAQGSFGGSFGTVYKAVWTTGKLIRKKEQIVAAKRNDKKEGEQEYKFLSELEHPNIVKLLGMVDNGVDIDIILEFCDGGSLRQYLDEHRGTKLGELFFDWTKQAGRPIVFLKEKGVVHKDIKSPNYLITSDKILKLCDFGLAKKVDTTMTSATERASYPWMAPELLKDSTLSPSYDIFAYGVVVWELWTTDPPFEGCESANLIYRICMKNERPLIPPDCPKQISDLMKQCWETDWKKRPSMEQAISMVESAAHDTLKKAIMTSHWELESVIGHQDGPGKLTRAGDIAVCPNGDIAVQDRGENSVCVYNNETVYKFSLDPSQRLNRGMTPKPGNITVNAHGIFYVTCNHFVFMFTAQGECKGRWAAMSPDNKPSDTEFKRLCGLTIDNKGQLLVEQVDSPSYISKHRQDGSHIASIKVRITPRYLAATSHDTIVISDWVSNTVQIVDSTGHMLHTLNRQVSFWYREGICCYHDIIFVCNSVGNNTHEISCFSVSAEYLGSISVKARPWGVAMANDGRLLVACGQSGVFVYRKKQLNSMTTSYHLPLKTYV